LSKWKWEKWTGREIKAKGCKVAKEAWGQFFPLGLNGEDSNEEEETAWIDDFSRGFEKERVEFMIRKLRKELVD
jgi:hypothetical protein